MRYPTERLTNAILAICPDITERVSRHCKPLDERGLWWELSTCILSSQVPYPLAVEAANIIDTEGLLLDVYQDSETLTKSLVKLLSKPLRIQGRPRKYRFPMARARQLAATRAVLTSKKSTLSELIDGFQDAFEARNWFVVNTPGVGPKQASMFLRNTGVSYELAILDRHVLNYMSMLGIFPGSKLFISGLAQYKKHEVVLRKHADELNCPVGILDWAIWIVMRVANQNMELVTV